MYITRFGDTYFPNIFTDFNSNFGDLVARTVRQPLMDGGFDELRGNRAPVEVGNVSASLWLKNPNPTAQQTAMDALRLMENYPGRSRLFAQPDGSAPVRWCFARLNSQQINQQFRQRPQAQQRVPLNWQVSDPRWRSRSGVAYLGEAAGILGSGTLTSISTTASAADGGTFTVVNAGSAPVPVVITVSPGTAVFSDRATRLLGLGDTAAAEIGATARGLGMRWTSSGLTPWTWFWNNELIAGEALIVDGEAQLVRHDTATGGVEAWADYVVDRGRVFEMLPPGSTTVEIFGTYAGSLDLVVETWDGWK